MIKLENKKALVIGGSGGIGAGTAKALAASGAHVALTYGKSRKQAEQVVREIEAGGGRAIALQADGLKRGSMSRVVGETINRLGGIDILVTAAGVFDTAALADTDDASFDVSFDLHVRSVIEAARAAVPDMPEGSTIITIGSIFGDIAPFPGLVLYTASKAAEAGVAKALARELGGKGITVNSIQPGPIDTAMNPADPEINPLAEETIAATALGRYGKPREIGDLVTFLASDSGRFVTGQTINVDGGWTA